MTLRLIRLLCASVLLLLLAPPAWNAFTGLTVTLPAWAAIPPGTWLALMLLALAVGLATADTLGLERLLGAALVGLALLMLVLSGIAASRGVAAPPGSAYAALLGLRPAALPALGLAALGGSLAVRRTPASRFDLSAVLGSIGAALCFLVTASHWYGASHLTDDVQAAASATGPLGAVLLLALALAGLASHPASPFAAYLGPEPGAVAKRRLLPAAVLTPIASGFLLLYALNGRQLAPGLAISLTVVANVLVMIWLINRTGNQVARVAQAKERQLEAREAAAKRQGLRDALTGLINRRGWDAAVQAAERRCRAEKLEAAIVIVDLDGLKRVNDSAGHKAGDTLIRSAAASLRKAARRGDALARLGGDEFGCLLVGCDAATAQAVVARFEQALREATVDASVGCAMRGARSLPQAFEEADQAMYRQKRARKLKRA